MRLKEAMRHGSIATRHHEGCYTNVIKKSDGTYDVASGSDGWAPSDSGENMTWDGVARWARYIKDGWELVALAD